MFDLEQAIAHWRRQLLKAGIQSAEVLSELEAHLREDLDRQIQSGTSPRDAFDRARQNLGSAAALGPEFRKVPGCSNLIEKLMLGICGMLMGLILFLSGVTIILCYESWGQRIMASAAVVSILLVARGWSCLVPYLPLIENNQLRWVSGLTCIGCGFLTSNLFCTFVLPHFEFAPDHQLPAIGLWAVFLMALFGSTGIGLLLSKQQREMWGMARYSPRSAAAAS